MTFLQALPTLVIHFVPLLLLFLAHAFNPVEWVRNKNRDRKSDNLIGSLLRTIDERNAAIREKDRTIQCQRETIERLEHRVAADVRTIKGQLNFIKIKDKILVSKNRLTKELNDKLVESDYHIRNLTWDIESLKAQVKEKDQQLWMAAGNHWSLRTNDGGCHEVLASSAPNSSGIDGREARKQKVLELTSKLQEAKKCFVKQTADAREYSAHMDEKTKDLRARMDKDTNDLCEVTSKLEEARQRIVKQTADARESRTLAEQQAMDRIAHLREAVYMNKNRNDAYAKLSKRYDAACKAAVLEREDFQCQIRTLNKKVQECRGRMSTVNVKILDAGALLSGTLKEKEELEIKLKTATQLAQEKSMDLAFARHALDNAINQLKSLNGQCNAHKLAKERFESALNTSQNSVAETKASMQAQKESANRYAHQLLKTEERYKESRALSVVLQSKLEAFTTQVSALQEKLSTSNTKVSALQAKLEASDSQVANLQEQYTTLKYTTTHLQDTLLATKTKTAAQDEELAIATSLATSFQERAAYFEHTAGNLEASLAAVQKALAKESRALASARSDLVTTRRTCHEAQVYGASHAGDLAAAKDTVAELKTRVEESKKAREGVAQELRQANDGLANAVNKLQTAMALAHRQKDQIADLKARVEESEKAGEKVAHLLRQTNDGRVTAVNKLHTAMALVYRQRDQKKQLEEALGEESRAREKAEGYVEVEGVVVDEEEQESDSDEEYESEYENDGDDEEDEEEEGEEEKEEEFENVEVIEGREPVEGEEGFEFVETE